MPWNWELPNWPKFKFNKGCIAQKEKQFLLQAGSTIAFLKDISEKEYHQFVIEILSIEGLESSRIEGEFLDRESLQSSIKQHFNLKSNQRKDGIKEAGMAEVLCEVYETFDIPLSDKMLWQWHAKLFHEKAHIEECGCYRTHIEPMQIVSRRYGSPRVFFEAPPSSKVPYEMAQYIQWFNSTLNNTSTLERAAIAHLYFESIHPFEDGNGRLGRILIEKILSQGVEKPVLVAVSRVLERRKKEYYEALGKCNRTLEVEDWVEFMAEVILQAQEESMELLYFLIEKSKMFARLSEHLNPRQEKVLLRIFAEGINGFKGGLSAENYIAIAKTSRATATRDLANLVAMGALTRTGELRHTRYWLNIPARNV